MKQDYVPWKFVLDANGDGKTTVSDLAAVSAQAFFLPGDTLIYDLLHSAPALGAFLELSPRSYGGWFSGVLSVLLWVGVLTVLVILQQVFENRARERELAERKAKRKALGYSDTKP